MQPTSVLDMQQSEFARLPIMFPTGPSFARTGNEWGAFSQGDGYRMYSVQDPKGRVLRAEVISPDGKIWFYQKNGKRRMQRCTEEQYAGQLPSRLADLISQGTWDILHR